MSVFFFNVRSSHPVVDASVIFILSNRMILLVECHTFLSGNVNVKKNNNNKKIYIY